MTLAEDFSVEVLGVSLAGEQLDLARERSAARGLDGKVSFALQDYFLIVRDRLNDNGLALIHSIVTKTPPGITGTFIRTYIFPGGYSPAISEVFGALERSGLWPLDVEVLRLHYALTLEHWAEHFAEHRDEATAMMDERFCRMWELYLATADGVFRRDSNAVPHLQVGRERDAVLVTRDYLWEARQQRAEAGPSA